ncbi:AMIN-like domain-containing (lipo)protein [Streptomyces globosus]|uniref:AMIN-like domain-containing (lipo)protein n=1 Tax=Streptomyces globosus TaxID=68209 RepID=UPI0031E0D8BC
MTTFYALTLDAQAGVAAEPISAAANCQGMRFSGVRAATHTGFDRFVVDLGEGPIPVWTDGIQTEPLTCCGDETNENVIPITGKSYLKLNLFPASSFDFNTQPSLYASPRHSSSISKASRGRA